MIVNQYKCTKKVLLDYCPDCVFILPNNQILLSTYDFINDDQKSGSLILMDENLQIIHKIDCEGILDFKVEQNIIYACTVLSRVILVTIVDNQLKIIKEYNYQNKANKLLYIDVLNNNILLGGDDGEVICQMLDNIVYAEKPHQYSVWCTKFDDQNQEIFYTGSDDAILNIYDNRTPGIVARYKKSHSVGITHILSEDSTLISNSYDGIIRFFDKRNFNAPIQEIKRKGGIWRMIKQNNIYLNALFQDYYYEMIDITGDHVKLIQIFEGQESLAYGMDWKNNIVVTLSYYQKLVQVFDLQCQKQFQI